jgi:hypothetical protein
MEKKFSCMFGNSEIILNYLWVKKENSVEIMMEVINNTRLIYHALIFPFNLVSVITSGDTAKANIVDFS